MTLAIRVLVGLVAGFLLGLALAGTSSPAATMTIGILTPVGTMFVNLIRMTAIPLVVSMLVASVGGMTASGGLGRTGVRALLVSVGLLAAAAIGSVLIAGPILARIPIDQAAALALRGPLTAGSQGAIAPSGTPTLAQWFVDLVPQNVVKAAADGAMLPVIVFAVMLGLALTRVSAGKREAALRVVDGFAEAMQRLVGWILGLAPIGVFALAVPLASRLGLSAAWAVVAYVALVVALTIVAVAVILYPIGIVAGRMSTPAFVSYCAPSQAIGFASRSSLAALPAMVASAERAQPPQLQLNGLPEWPAVVVHASVAGNRINLVIRDKAVEAGEATALYQRLRGQLRAAGLDLGHLIVNGQTVTGEDDAGALLQITQ